MLSPDMVRFVVAVLAGQRGKYAISWSKRRFQVSEFSLRFFFSRSYWSFCLKNEEKTCTGSKFDSSTMYTYAFHIRLLHEWRHTEVVWLLPFAVLLPHIGPKYSIKASLNFRRRTVSSDFLVRVDEIWEKMKPCSNTIHKYHVSLFKVVFKLVKIYTLDVG